jgi:transposase
MALPPSHSQTVLPAHNLILDKVERTVDRFRLHVHVQQQVRCPACDQASRRRHSVYLRSLKDLPWQGCAVELRLKVRRFRCHNAACARKIFAEPIPEVARSQARRTTRVAEIIRLIGYTAGGLPGSRILQRLAIPVSDDTVIRTVKQSHSAPVADPIRSVGVDDWAWRKGQNYGTILVDLDKHRVVDLLPDRTTEGVTRWLEAHPSIEIVSRDRCGIYAQAAQQGAADALQVADRFHLLMNLSAAMERALEERSSELCFAADGQESDPVVAPPKEEKKITLAEQRKQQRRARRNELYKRVIELHGLGYTQCAISAEVGIERKTIRRWLRAGQFPERKPPTGRRSHVREFHDYLQQRWNDGCHNATRLFEEIRTRGYRGSRQMVSHHVSSWRTRPRSRSSSKKKKLDRIAPKHAAILACRPEERLSEQQRALFEQVAVHCPTLRWMRTLAMDFREAIRSQNREGMINWIRTAAHTGIGPVARFSYGLKKDLGAVIAAVETPWSNGQIEGQINRLKAIKRQMYGRAGFHLLRARVLPYHAMAP